MNETPAKTPMDKKNRRLFKWIGKRINPPGFNDFDRDTKVVAERRIAKQIDFMDLRSQQNQVKYKWLKGLGILTGVSITLAPGFLGFIGRENCVAFVVPLLGGIILLLDRVISLNDCRGNWLHYRETCEALTHEKYWYLARSHVYADTDNPARLLSERTEAIVQGARESWMNLRLAEDKGTSSSLPKPKGSLPSNDHESL